MQKTHQKSILWLKCTLVFKLIEYHNPLCLSGYYTMFAPLWSGQQLTQPKRNLYDYSLAELSAGIDQLAEYKKSHADQGCQLGIIGYKIGLSSNASSTAKLPWQLKPAPQNKLGSKSD